MKVLSIQEKHTQADHKLYFKIALEGVRLPLILWDPPQFAAGNDLPESNLVVVGEGDRQTYSLKTDSRTEQGSEKDASIREQTAIKAIIDIFNAGRMQESQESSDYLVVNAREWINSALIHGTLMSGLLEGKIHPINGAKQ